jgi:hypothetical protein
VIARGCAESRPRRDGVFASELDKPHLEHLLYFRSDRSDAYDAATAGTSIVVATIGERRWVVRMPRR